MTPRSCAPACGTCPVPGRRAADPWAVARRAAWALAACLVLGTHAPVHAEPEATRPDPVLQLLRERGLIDGAMQARAAPVVQQWRDAASELVLGAMGFLGVPYRRGGSSAEGGFDCSGFTRHVFEHSVGLLLPRRADEQARHAALRAVRRDELRPGDLVFFNTLRRAFSHVGIYVGDGKFIHAPRAGAEVRIEDMRAAYWQRRFDGARRAALGDVAAGGAAAPAGTSRPLPDGAAALVPAAEAAAQRP